MGIIIKLNNSLLDELRKILHRAKTTWWIKISQHCLL